MLGLGDETEQRESSSGVVAGTGCCQADGESVMMLVLVLELGVAN